MISARQIIPRTRPAVATMMLAALVSAQPLWGQADAWTTKEPLPAPRAGMAVGEIDGVIYLAGGFGCPAPGLCADTLAYQPKTNTWEIGGPIPTPRGDPCVAALDGMLYVVGGVTVSGSVSTVEAYNPKTSTWVSKPPVPTARFGCVAGVVDGVLYVIGGVNSFSGVLGTTEAYDPKVGTWTGRAPMPTIRTEAAGGVIDGILYVAGGGPPLGISGALEAYDPTTDTWSVKTTMPTPRVHAGSGVLDGNLYVIGGAKSSSTDVHTVEVYDPETNSWTTGPDLPTARWGLGATVVDDVLYALGGVAPSGTPVLQVNEAFSPFLMVGLDIKPGDARNTINLRSRGTLPVAILGSASFDPMTVDPETVTLAGAPVARRGFGVVMSARGDFNHDGYFDLLLHFRTQELELAPSATEAVLYGETFSGERIRGADSLRLVPLPLPPAAQAQQDSKPGRGNRKWR